MSSDKMHRRIGDALEALAPEPPVIEDLADRVIARHGRRRRARLHGLGVAVGILVVIAVPLVAGVHARPAETPPSAASNRTAARHDIASRLAGFTPPHASVLAAAPTGVQSFGPARVSGGEGSEYMLSATRWWSSDESVSSVSDWIKAYVPPTAWVQTSSSSITPEGEPSDWYELRWPDVKDVLGQRLLDIHATSDGFRTVLEATASVIWLPERPTMPPSIAAVRITLTKDPHLGSPDAPAETLGPVTITDADRVRNVVAMVDSVPVATPDVGPISCLPGFGGKMSVLFLDKAGNVQATLTNLLAGCDRNVFTTRDGTRIGLADPDHGPDLGTQIVSLLGLHWTWGS